MTLSEILSTYPVGSDERRKAIQDWRKLEDERLAANPRPVKVPTGKRAGRPPVTSPAVPAAIPTPVHPDSQLARAAWEDRRSAAQSAKESEQASALRVRIVHAVKLTAVRVNALPDVPTRREKLARLAEIEASLVSHSPKTLVAGSRGLVAIEERLARLSAD
jgi:hypothetical protein